MAGHTSPETAFAYIEGKLYYGPNHLDIMDKLGLLLDDFNTLREGAKGPSAWGWIFEESDGTQEAEFYSDFYENRATDSAFFESVYAQLKKDYPKLSEFTFGPGEKLMHEIIDYFDPDEMETWNLPIPSHYKVSFRWDRKNGLKIV